MEPESSLTFSQEIATGPYPELDESSPISLKPISYFPFIYASPKLNLLFMFSNQKFGMHFLSLPFMLHAPRIQFSLS